MTAPFPEDLPGDLPIPDVSPNVASEVPLDTSELRVFRIGAPMDTHFQQISCVALDCPEYLYGFRIVADSTTDVGRRQISHILGSTLDYTSFWTPEDDLVTFLFPRGQNSPRIHVQRRSDVAANYVIVNGSADPNGVGPAAWLTQIRQHMRTLFDTQSNVMHNVPVGMETRRVPVFTRDDDIGVPSLGYGIFISNHDLTPHITAVNIITPLDSFDTSRPVRLATLSDFRLIVTGVRDTSTPSVVRSMRGLINMDLGWRLQVNQFHLGFICRVISYNVAMSASGVTIWRIIARMDPQRLVN